ncbi:hypothetical protein MRB53_000490 [Persea americana]|uniref:Uncharacterized protein n=1 Tax=Persea americana TaxID=3435 RepID=A0ACC2MP21_PERAE|nr:hypothetical protein MRB53_000490 [Persea americana]
MSERGKEGCREEEKVNFEFDGVDAMRGENDREMPSDEYGRIARTRAFALCDEGVLAMRNNELSRAYEPGKGKGKKGEADGSC